MSIIIRKFFFFFFILLCFSVSRAGAANWLTIIGTVPEDTTFKVWGLIQPLYTYDTGDKLKGLRGGATVNNDKYVIKNTVGPWYDDQKKLQFRRLRTGVRGRFWGKLKNSFTKKINYSIVLAAGTNLSTYIPFGEKQRDVALTDCFFTYNLLPATWLQAGLFKNPGPDEVFRPMSRSNYIQVSDFIGRVYLERFSTGSTRQRNYGGLNQDIGTPVTTAYGFSMDRDWGLQLFSSNCWSNWDFSWAVKLGRGEDIYQNSDHDHNRELYLYSSLEYYLPGGKEYNKNGIKFFGWYQDGKRCFASDPIKKDYDRILWGMGCSALDNFFGCSFKQRFSIELFYAEGMIFTAPTGNVKGGLLQYAADKGNKSRGTTLDYGLYLQKWQFDIRYHCNDMLYETDNKVWVHGDARTMEETTLGVTYHFTPKIRLTANYIFRDADAPYTDSHNTEIVVSSVKNRAALQLTWIL